MLRRKQSKEKPQVVRLGQREIETLGLVNGANGHANGDAAALLDLLRRTIGSSVDANQVREIVEATIKDKADAIAADLKNLILPVTRVQLVAPSGEIREVDGPQERDKNSQCPN
jgi:hypothetical protein